jgi:hypothetical protein
VPPVARAAAWATALAVCGLLAACKSKVTPAQCDLLVDRYAQLVVNEKFPDASAEMIRSERERERSEAHADDTFKNCSSEVNEPEFSCAMRATTADALEKCLE